jgi:hypothetical protein
MMLMTGCAAVDLQESSARVPVQYATLKVIEDSDSIAARDVLQHTERVRQVVVNDAEINISQLVDNTIDLIGIDSFEASDRLLLMILFNNIQQAVIDVRPDMPLQEQRVRLLTLLDWIDQAARLAQ